jgi:hypothetical protein
MDALDLAKLANEQSAVALKQSDSEAHGAIGRSSRLPLTSPDAWSHLAHPVRSLAHLDCQMIALAFLAGFVAMLESPGPPVR